MCQAGVSSDGRTFLARCLKSAEGIDTKWRLYKAVYEGHEAIALSLGSRPL